MAAGALLAASVFLLSVPLSFARSAQISSWSAPAVGVEFLRSALLDGPGTLLTAWLLREMAPVVFSSRYPLIVAVTVGEGYLLLRPQLDWTTALGMLLLVSGARLLTADLREVS